MKKSLLILNAVVFQLCWFALVVWQYHGIVPALLLLTIFYAFHYRAQKNAYSDTVQLKSEAALILVIMVLGSTIDTLLFNLGVFSFEQPLGERFVPGYLIVLWLAFAATLRHSLAWLRDKTLLAVAFGGIGGTLSYYAGSKFNAVALPLSYSTTIPIIAFVWAILFPITLRVANPSR